MIGRYREVALQVAKEAEVSLVDLNQLLTKEPSWLSKNGVHPSKAGNVIIAKHAAEAVKPLIEELASSANFRNGSSQTRDKTHQSRGLGSVSTD